MIRKSFKGDKCFNGGFVTKEYCNAVLAILIIITALITSCSNDPDVIISGSKIEGTIYGTIYPITLKATVYLIGNGDTLARTTTNGSDGKYEFHSLRVELYSITALFNEWYAEITVYINSPTLFRTDLEMYRGRKHIQLSGVQSEDTIKIKRFYRDTLISFGFNARTKTSFNECSLSISPFRLNDDYVVTVSRDDYINIAFKSDSLFQTEILQIRVRYNTEVVVGLLKKDSIDFTWTVDSTGFDSIRTEQLIKQIRVENKSYVNSSYPDHNINNMNPEHEIALVFNKPMDRQSVQKSIRIDPAVPVMYFWSRDTLKIVPSNALLPESSYILVIDTTAMTADSQFFRCPYRIAITTTSATFFLNCWPMDGTRKASLKLPFTFESPYSIEPLLLENAFTINPPVDSLQFVVTQPGVINVRHAPLLPDTTYQIVINSTMASRKGTVLGEDFIITFSTEGK